MQGKGGRRPDDGARADAAMISVIDQEWILEMSTTLFLR
jgi:hypothetical protein